MFPGAEQVIVDIEKLRDYCLNSNHPRGKHKAKVFRSVLGFTESDAAELKAEIENQVRANPCEIGKKDQYGQRYTVEIAIVREGSKAIVLTAWILKQNEDTPRLTSCYVK